MKKYFSEILAAFLAFTSVYAEVDGMNKSLTRNDSNSKLQAYSDEQENQFHRFSPLEYIQLAKKFSDVHNISPSLDIAMRNEYDKTVGQLRKLGKVFGFKRYSDIHSPVFLRVISVDSSEASWQGLIKIIEDHLDDVPVKFKNLVFKLSDQLKTTGRPSSDDVRLFIETTVGRVPEAFFDVSQLSSESEQIFRETLLHVLSDNDIVVSTSDGDVSGADIFLKAMLLFARSVLVNYKDLPEWFSSIEINTSMQVPEIISIDVSFPNLKRVIESIDTYKNATETPITDVDENTTITVEHLKWLYNTRFAAQIARMERKEGNASNKSYLSDEDIEFLINITVGGKNRLFDVSAMSYRLILDLIAALQQCGTFKGVGRFSDYADELVKLSDKFKLFWLLAGEENGLSEKCRYVQSKEKFKMFLEKFLKTLTYTREFLNLLRGAVQSGMKISENELSSQILSSLNANDFFGPELPSELKEFGRELQQKIKDVLFPGDRDTFKSILREVLRNSTGFQRVMSLIGGSIISKDSQWPLANNNFRNLKIYFVSDGNSFTPTSNFINIDMNSKDYIEFDWTVLHELSHAYHHMVNCNIPDNNDEWFVNFSVMNSESIDFISQFYPVLSSKNMSILPESGERVKEDGVYTTDNLLNIATMAIKFGFGNVLFDSVDYNASFSTSRNNRFLSRCLYLDRFILQNIHEEGENSKDQVWHRTEEMLTMQGIVPFMVNGKCIILEDRQNEHIFRVRKDAENAKTEKELESNTYRVHASSGAQYGCDEISSLVFLNIMFGVDYGNLKLDYYPSNTKFEETNRAEMWPYKSGKNVVPDCLSYLYEEGRDISSYDLPDDLSLLISDIEAKQVEMKSIRYENCSGIINSLGRAVKSKNQKKINAIVDLIIKIGDGNLCYNALIEIAPHNELSKARNLIIDSILQTSNNSLYYRALRYIIRFQDEEELLPAAYKFIERMASSDNGVCSIVSLISDIDHSSIYIYDSILSKLHKLRPNWKEVIKAGDSNKSFHIFHTAIIGDKDEIINVFLEDKNWLSSNQVLLDNLKDPDSDLRWQINCYIGCSMLEDDETYDYEPEESLFAKLEATKKSSPSIEISRKLKDLVLTATTVNAK